MKAQQILLFMYIDNTLLIMKKFLIRCFRFLVSQINWQVLVHELLLAPGDGVSCVHKAKESLWIANGVSMR